MTTQPQYSNLNNVLISALCLYDRKDERLRLQLESYLGILYQRQVIHQIKYQEIEDYTSKQRNLQNEVERTDLMILLVTSHFLATDFCYSPALRQLIEADQLKKICIVPILFKECEIDNSQLVNLDRLPCNELPLVNEYTSHFEKPLLLMSEQLEYRIQGHRFWKHQIEEQWGEAKEVNEYNTYRSFLKTFPFCKYADIAREKADKIVEQKLWKEALSFDNVEYYMNYLREAPLRNYEETAVDRIAEIEDSEDQAGKEALESKPPALLFDYINRFPNGREYYQVEDEIKEFLNDPFLEEHQSGDVAKDNNNQVALLKTESQQLLIQSFDKLQPNELLALDRYYRYGERLLGASIGCMKHVGNQKFSLILLLTGFASIFGMMYIMTLSSKLDGALGSFKLPLYTLLVFFVYRVALAFRYFQDDLKYSHKTAVLMRRNLVRLKVAALLHDKALTNKVLRDFVAADMKLSKIKRSNYLYYLRGRTKEKTPPPMKSPPKLADKKGS